MALEKEEHGKAKRRATRRHCDPRPPNMTIPDPRERLQLAKDLEAEHERQRNQDTTGRVGKYGSSCLFSLLQPTSSEESAEETSGHYSESIDSEADSEAMAAACTSTISSTGIPVLSEEDFFKTCVEVSQERADALEERTRLQSSSNEWFLERRKRITATLVKAVECRRSSDISPIVARKLSCMHFRGTRATQYGLEYEGQALRQFRSIMEQQLRKEVSVRQSGLVVKADEHWLSASPEGFFYNIRLHVRRKNQVPLLRPGLVDQ